MAGIRDRKHGPLAPGRTVWHCIAKAHRNLIDAKVAITLIEIRLMTKNISTEYMVLFHNEAGVVCLFFGKLVSYRCAHSIHSSLRSSPGVEGHPPTQAQIRSLSATHSCTSINDNVNRHVRRYQRVVPLSRPYHQGHYFIQPEGFACWYKPQISCTVLAGHS